MYPSRAPYHSYAQLSHHSSYSSNQAEMSLDLPVPETKVLAIASHVSLSACFHSGGVCG